MENDLSLLARRLARQADAAVAWTAADDDRLRSIAGLEPVAPAPPPPPAPPPAAVWPFSQPVLTENFDGPLDLTRWNVYSSPGNHSKFPGLRRASAVTVVGGQLVITATYDPLAKTIVSGGIQHRFDWGFGMLEARIRTEVDPTFQMSGVGLRWPMGSVLMGDGEYDWYETTRATDGHVRAFYHYAGALNKQESFRHPTALRDAWHTLRWIAEPDKIRLYIDEALAWTVTDPAVLANLARNGHVDLQLDTFGNHKNASGVVDGYTPLVAPVRMFVDYLRIWQ